MSKGQVSKGLVSKRQVYKEQLSKGQVSKGQMSKGQIKRQVSSFNAYRLKRCKMCCSPKNRNAKEDTMRKIPGTNHQK